MKKINLTHGKVALVDEQDYFRLMKYKWIAFNIYSDKFVARNHKLGMLHKFILKEDPNEEFEVRFINGDYLDCRRENMEKLNSKIKESKIELVKKNVQLEFFNSKFSDIKTAEIISANNSGVFEKIVYEAKYVSPEGRVFNFGTYNTPEEAKLNYEKNIKLICK